MLLYKKNKYIFDSSIDFYYSFKLSCLFIKGNNGFVKIFMPSYYFYKLDESSFSFLFLNNFYFKSFLSHLSTFSKRLSFFYFLKLKIRGLGFRIRFVSKSLCFFFFNYTNNYYFHVPSDLIVKIYKKRIFLFSYNWSRLRLIFVHFLFLKKLGPYRRLGIRYKRQIVLLKKLEKKF